MSKLNGAPLILPDEDDASAVRYDTNFEDDILAVS